MEVPPDWLSIYWLSSISAIMLPLVFQLFVFGSQIVGNTVSTTETAGLCQNYRLSSFLARRETNSSQIANSTLQSPSREEATSHTKVLEQVAKLLDFVSRAFQHLESSANLMRLLKAVNAFK